MPSWSFSYSSPLLPKERRGKPKRKKGRNGEIPVADGKGAASHGVACCSLLICVCTCVCACCVWMVMIRECNWARISVYLYLSMDVSVYLSIYLYLIHMCVSCGWLIVLVIIWRWRLVIQRTTPTHTLCPKSFPFHGWFGISSLSIILWVE